MSAAEHPADGPIVIAAGGTGGHLFPGQALAQELKRRGRSVVLMTDERVRKFDTLFPGVDVYAVQAATFARQGLFGKLKALGAIVAGTVQAYRLLGRIRPSAVIGFGGYPTLPPVAAALLRGIPTCVHEQNAVLGRVNRLAAPYVTAIASTFPEPKHLRADSAPKLVVTGNPVRDAVIEKARAPYTPPGGGDPVRLLVVGGSQGARVLSDVMPGALAQMPRGIRGRLSVTQQCRPEDLDRVRTTYAAAGIAASLSTFFDDMPVRIANAHLVIGRSGASTVSELAAIGRPAVLVPLPQSLDNDQKANALVLADAGAAWMVEQAGFTETAVAQLLERLIGDPDLLAAAAKSARGLGQPYAAMHLANLVDRIAARRALPVGDAGRAASGNGERSGMFFVSGDAP